MTADCRKHAGSAGLILTLGILLPGFLWAADGSTFVSQSVNTTMVAGDTQWVTITFSNSGDTTWDESLNYCLGAQNPQDNGTWGLGRVYLNTGEQVIPGQSKTFGFLITGPFPAGPYDFQWRMLQEGNSWFGDFSTNVVITVIQPTNTRTRTRTPTPSHTRSSTPTPTMTASTPSASPTLSLTPTPSSTFTATPTFSPSFTRTATPTRTLTSTSTIPPVFTATTLVTPKSTPTLTPGSSLTPTPALTMTATRVVPAETRTPTENATIYTAPSQSNTVYTYPSPAKGNQLWFYYYVPGPAKVQIVIKNVIGENFHELRDETSAAGYQRTDWNIKGVAPGIYFYRLIISSDQEKREEGWRKIVIVK